MILKADSIKIIGINQSSRRDALFYDLNEEKDLLAILEMEFSYWSNFDNWSSLQSQQWVFFRALEIYKGNKLDIRCNCCEFPSLSSDNFKNHPLLKCYGLKARFIINKIFDEIVLSSSRRVNDGTYNN